MNREGKHATKLSDAEIEQRLEALRLSKASSATEGLRADPKDAGLLESLARGEISEEEFMRRLFELASNSIWNVLPIDDEPEIQLIQWDIKRDTAGNRYFVGTLADDGSGRVSTAILEFDSERRRGRTRSGRVYELLGAPGRSRNGEYVWSLYKKLNGITELER